MGLVGVLATQLWHHTFIDPHLADLPSRKEWALGDREWGTPNGRQDGQQKAVVGPHLPHAPLPIPQS
jgi:hypothetical protein